MENSGNEKKLNGLLDNVLDKAKQALSAKDADLYLSETGIVWHVAKGIARVKGLPGVKSDELVLFPGGKYGIAFNLEPDDISVVMLDFSDDISAGMEVKRTGRVVDVPVGEALLGRVVNPLGAPLDNGKKIETTIRYPIERESPAIMDRAPVSVPLQTGILAIDALIPIGKGQRELILGDRQVGKSSVVLDTIINQKDKNVICVYCSISQQSSGTAKFIEDLRKYNAMEYTIVVAASGDESPGMNFIAPYAACSMAEYFMEKGRDVLIIYDDLSRHARAYRELSLLLRRPPAREAYPGDIFYIHSRLLERATRLIQEKGGGSLTALPIIETEAQNIAAYIPTNLVSITDGQIYLSPKLYQEGIMPPVDVGQSVSRVGGQAQITAYREVAGNLKLSYSQFEELEVFERFSTRLDEPTRKALDRGHRIREVLKQPQYKPLSVVAQVVILLCVTEGLLDGVDLNKISEIKEKLGQFAETGLAGIKDSIMSGRKLSPEEKKKILEEAVKLIPQNKQDVKNGVS